MESLLIEALNALLTLGMQIAVGLALAAMGL